MTTTLERGTERGAVPETAESTDPISEASTGVSADDLIESTRRARGRDRETPGGPAGEKEPETGASLSISSLLERLSSGFTMLGSSLWGLISEMLEEPKAKSAATYTTYRSRRPEEDTRAPISPIEEERFQLSPSPEQRTDTIIPFAELEEDLDEKRQWHLSNALNELGEAERRQNEREDKERKLAEMLSVEKEAVSIQNPQQLAAKLREISARAQEYARDTGDDMRNEVASIEAVQEILRRWQVLEERLTAAGFDPRREENAAREEPGSIADTYAPSTAAETTVAVTTGNSAAPEPGVTREEPRRRERPTIAGLQRTMTDLERAADELIATHAA